MCRDAQLTDLYQAYQPQILRLLRYLTGSSMVAEELTQDVFLRAYQALAYTPTDDQVLLWLYQIARNVARDYRRYTGAQRRSAVTMPFDANRDSRCDVQTAEQVLASADSARDLLAVINNLAPDYRQVLVLLALGYDYRAIAQRMGRSHNAVKILIWRARRAAWARIGIDRGRARAV